eukprot:gene8920-16545_t
MDNHQDDNNNFFGEEHFHARGVSPSTDNLFSNRDVLERRLKYRLEREDLIVRGILPANHASPSLAAQIHQLERAKTGDILQKKIRVRSSRQQLVQRHILADSKIDASLQGKQSALERHRIADSLNEQLFNRPGPLELVRENILKVEPNFADAVKHGCVPFHPSCRDVSTSPVSSLYPDSPLSEVDASRCSIDSLSPVAGDPIDTFSRAFSEHVKVESIPVSNNVSSAVSELESCIVSTSDFFSNNNVRAKEPAIRKQSKGNRKKQQSQNKQKIKRYKYHEYKPPGIMPPTYQAPLDDRYKRLLEQQQMFLQLQVMKQNALFEAINGSLKDPVKDKMDVEESSHCQNESQLSPTPTNAPVSYSNCAGLDDMKVSDLRSELRQRGLPVSGSKAKLLERLKSYEDRKIATAEEKLADVAFSPVPANMPTNTSSAQDSVQESCPTTAHGSSFIKVTTYAGQNGETFQLVQAVPSSEIQYQLIPSSVVLGHGQSENVPVQQLGVHGGLHTKGVLQVPASVSSIDQRVLQNVMSSVVSQPNQSFPKVVDQSVSQSVNQQLINTSEVQIHLSQPATHTLAGNALLDLTSALDRHPNPVIDALTLQMLSEHVNHQASKPQATIETQTSYEPSETDSAADFRHTSLLNKLQSMQENSQQAESCHHLQNHEHVSAGNEQQGSPHHYQWEINTGGQTRGKHNRQYETNIGQVRDRSQTDPLMSRSTVDMYASQDRSAHMAANCHTERTDDAGTYIKTNGKDLRTFSLPSGIMETNMKCPSDASDDLMDILGELSGSAAPPLDANENQSIGYARYAQTLQNEMQVKGEPSSFHLTSSKNKTLTPHVLTSQRPYGSLPGDLNLLGAGLNLNTTPSLLATGSLHNIPHRASSNAMNTGHNAHGLALNSMDIDDVDMETDQSYFSANDLDWPGLHQLDNTNSSHNRQIDKPVGKDLDNHHCVDGLHLDLMSANLYEDTKSHDPLSIFDVEGSHHLLMAADSHDTEKWDF